MDFLANLSPLSAPLIQIPTIAPTAYSDLPMGSFITIDSVTCFKRFEARYLNGVGDANIYRTLGQIRELSSLGICALLFGIIVASHHLILKRAIFSLVKEVICKLPWNIAFYLIWNWMKDPEDIWIKVTS